MSERRNESPAATTESRPEILDACCGGRMWWWDKAHPLATYIDKRERPARTIRQKPLWKIAPDVVADFRSLPFEDESFQLVVFDPPHQVASRAGTGINAEQYGSWEPGERDEALRLGFAECWRVLRPGGTLVFKWAGKVAEVEPTFPVVPVVGTRPRGRKTGPSWVIFYKPLGAAPTGSMRGRCPLVASRRVACSCCAACTASPASRTGSDTFSASGSASAYGALRL